MSLNEILEEIRLGRSDRPVFTVPKPLPQRKRDADGNFLPDPPLGEPYPGYSMMDMLRREKEAFREREWTRHQENVRKHSPRSCGQSHVPNAETEKALREAQAMTGRRRWKKKKKG